MAELDVPREQHASDPACSKRAFHPVFASNDHPGVRDVALLLTSQHECTNGVGAYF